jgi:SAM-dependent MidA family methyltransferase
MLGNPLLIELILGEIRKVGPIPFEKFMELALYQPLHGYYSRNSPSNIGRQGDFYTNVSVGSYFGKLMSQQFQEIWEIFEKPKSFHVVEQGANSGQFAIDSLTSIRESDPIFFSAIKYIIIEPLDSLQSVQQANLKNGGLSEKVIWLKDFSEQQKETLTGVFFSNELVDSFPVHRIVRHQNSWRESYVDYVSDKFVFIDKPISETKLEQAIQQASIPLLEGYTTEINVRAQSWIGNVASLFSKSVIITIDYGYPADIYYSPERTEGTLLCYYQHRKSVDPLVRVGEQDITAHVDFTGLTYAGKKAGLTFSGFTDQHHFLIGVMHDQMEKNDVSISSSAFKTLIHPELMGTRFKFLVQTKGFSGSFKIKGLKFAKQILA